MKRWRWSPFNDHVESIASCCEAKGSQSKYFFSTTLQIHPDKMLTITREIFWLACFF